MKKLLRIATTTLLSFSALALAAPDTESAIGPPPYVTQANPNINATTEDETIVINDALKVVPKNFHEQNDELHYSIHVTYPQIDGEHLSKEAVTFNTRMDEIVMQQVQTFKNNVQQDWAHMQTLPSEVQKNTFTIDYDIDVFHPERLDLISVRLSTEGFQAGRAHPYHTHEVLNFDLTHGQELALKDLFKANTHYLQRLAKYSNQELNHSLKNNDKWMIAQGTKPELKNYKNWNLEEDAILITFDEYQVAPYYYGALEIEVPYAELKNILSTKATIISSLSNPSKKIG